MKKLLALTTAAMLMFSAMGVTAFADDGVKLVVNGETVDFAGDQEPVIQDGRTLVPFRAAFEKMGADVTWYDDARYCEASYGGVVVGIAIDDTKVYINDGAEIESDVPAQIINDRTMVPLRVLSESIGAKVDWDSETKTVTVTTPEIKGEAPEKVNYETKTDVVEGSVSKITYSYPVVTDEYTFADLLNKNIEADAKDVATTIANENGSGKSELNIDIDIKDNGSGLFTIMYLIDGEDVALYSYGISDGAKLTEEGYYNALFGGELKSDDYRYELKDYTAYSKCTDGDVCIEAFAYYPQFTGEAEVFASLNTQLENSAKKVADAFIASYADEAAKAYDAQEDSEDKTIPYSFVQDVNVEISDDNIATITTSFTESVLGNDDRTSEDVIKVDLNTGEVL